VKCTVLRRQQGFFEIKVSSLLFAIEDAVTVGVNSAVGIFITGVDLTDIEFSALGILKILVKIY
jgi:hypothetical protein